VTLPSRPALIALGAAVAAAIVVAVVLLAVRDGGSAPSDGEADAGRAGEDQAGAGDDEVARVIEEVQTFVGAVRDLDWLRDVEVELADDEAFRARLLEDAVEDREELEQDAAVLRALRLLADDVDLYDALLAFLGDSVIGFYDPETDELVLRGTSLSPYVRSTLAHELTHALDDQHFELHRPDLDDADDESGLAFSSVVEGNAVRVERAYRETMSDEERAELRREEEQLAAGIDFASIPPVLPLIIGFPYIYGPPFVEAIHAEGGERAVDDALRSPPTTSEHILSPETWIAGELATDVPEPDAGGEVVDSGTYGQWALHITLVGEVGQRAAADAARGWGGDAYVAWRDGERTCVRARFAMDTDDDLAELTAALEEWTVAHDDAALEREPGRVGFTACG
jgi:hypothetical protein